MTDSLSNRLVKARSGMGWSQQGLAEVSGVAAAQISRYESGRSAPRAEVIARLAKALNIEFDWLANGTGPIETGQDIAKYPTGIRVIEAFDIPPEHYEAIAKFAEEEGLNMEMALRKLVLDALVLRQEDRNDLEEIRRRIDKLERGDRSS